MPIAFNGWQRVWLVLLLVSTLPLGAYIYHKLPTESDIGHHLRFYRQLKSQSIEKLSGTLTAISFDEDAKDSGIEIEMPNRHVLRFRNGVPHEEIIAVGEEYMTILEREAAEKRRRFLAITIAAWLVSGGLIYAIGWGVAWVIRGFRNA